MQIPDINSLVEKVSPFAQAIVALVLAFLLIEKAYSRKNGKPEESKKSKTEPICACSEIITLTTEFRNMKENLEKWMDAAHADSEKKWEIINTHTTKIAVIEAGGRK